MTIEETIAALQGERADASRGETAHPGNPYYDAQSRLDFQPCRCSYSDSDYASHEYIAKGPRGGTYFVALNLNTGIISCGQKGYHYLRSSTPCV
jgi:hypothetical protein